MNMNDWFIKKYLISAIILLVTAAFFSELKSLINQVFTERHFLIIGIFSAPDNYQQRQSLRKTWLKLTKNVPVVYHFLIGNEICNVHPVDRTNPYSCEENHISLSNDVSPEHEFSTIKKGNHKLVGNYIGFGFYTQDKIIVKTLGVPSKILRNMKSEIQIQLVSSYNGEVLASVTFDPQLASESKTQLIFKSINPVVLPQDYEARVMLTLLQSENNLLPPCEGLSWDNEPGAISFIQLIKEQNSKPWTFMNDSCPPVFMNYSIADIGKWKEKINAKDNRKAEWMLKKIKIMKNLNNEQETYQDLILLPVTDVYRNLPRKLVEFFKLIEAIKSYQYVLKTDDDTFVDILRVYNQLEIASKGVKEGSGNFHQAAEENKLWWWSYFKERWKVQDSGKWREDKYRSASYPPFPCGGGYIVNRGIVQYIVKNEHHLQLFQGEDVSMGIWLAGLSAAYYSASTTSKHQTHRIEEQMIRTHGPSSSGIPFQMTRETDTCDWSCDQHRERDIPLCNKVQLSVNDMYQTWDNFTVHGIL